MHWIFRALTDRLKALFVADVATDFEAQLLARDAERKAELLRQAQKYEDEGLKAIAQDLRQQTECLGTQRPLASVLPAIEHLRQTQANLFPDDEPATTILLPAPAPICDKPVTGKCSKKKGR